MLSGDGDFQYGHIECTTLNDDDATAVTLTGNDLIFGKADGLHHSVVDDDMTI